MQNKTMHKIITMSIMLLISIANHATDVRIRGQSVDTARELAGWTNHVNLYDVGNNWYGSFALTPEYTQSFNDRQIARSLFGTALIANNSFDNDISCNDKKKQGASFRISGSQATDRQAGDLLADYFGLPLDYQSTVTVRPEIQNGLLDFDFFVGVDKYIEGLWFRIHAPVVYAKWKLRMEETIADAGVAGYPAGYLAPVAIPTSALNTSFVSYLRGDAPDLTSYGVTFEPLHNAVFKHGIISSSECENLSPECECECENTVTCTSGGKQSTVRLSDIRFALGQNFWQCDDYHVGIGLLVSAPTGTKVNDKYLFQPFVGNAHHWELGAKFTSHYTFWRSCDDDKNMGIYFDADATTMLATRQFRVFDICGAGDDSKYMLAEQMTNVITNELSGLVDGTPVASLYQYNNVVTPVANITGQHVKVNQDFQLDLTVMFNYTHCNFAFDFGYNYWMTSRERIRPLSCEDLLLRGNHTYALKGDALVYGYNAAITTPPGYQQLGATESLATICSGTNVTIGSGLTVATSTNASIDNAQTAYSDTLAVTLYTAPGGATPVDTSIQPVFLANQNVDYAGNLAEGTSNKIFGHLSYTWADCRCCMPYLGIGGKAEWVPNRKKCNELSVCGNSTGCGKITSSCSSCGEDSGRRTNINEWGIWLKGGVSF